MVPKIFISYACQDIMIAEKIYHYLKDKEYNVWIDIHNLMPGENWQNTIIKEINESSVILVILSENSVTKVGYFQRELFEAIERSKYFPNNKVFIIPIKLDSTSIPVELKHIHYLDVSKSLDEGLYKLYYTLESLFIVEMSEMRDVKKIKLREKIINEILGDQTLLETLKHFNYSAGRPEEEKKIDSKLEFFNKYDLTDRIHESRINQMTDEYKEYDTTIRLNRNGRDILELITGKY